MVEYIVRPVVNPKRDSGNRLTRLVNALRFRGLTALVVVFTGAIGVAACGDGSFGNSQPDQETQPTNPPPASSPEPPLTENPFPRLPTPPKTNGEGLNDWSFLTDSELNLCRFENQMLYCGSDRTGNLPAQRRLPADRGLGMADHPIDRSLLETFQSSLDPKSDGHSPCERYVDSQKGQHCQEYIFNSDLTLTDARYAVAAGLQGQAVGIGILDDYFNGANRRPNFVGAGDLQLRYRKNFTEDACAPSCFDQGGPDSGSHGDTVTSIMAAPLDGRNLVGIAPKANYYQFGVGGVNPVPDGNSIVNSIVILDNYIRSALQRILDLKDDPVRVINMSFGATGTSSSSLSEHVGSLGYWEPFLKLIERGKLFVIASGNGIERSGHEDVIDKASCYEMADDGSRMKDPDGPDCAERAPVWPAGVAPYAIARKQVLVVGALNAEGNDIAVYSNRAGNARNYFLLAPGSNTYWRESQDSSGNRQKNGGYGTSYAAPLVTGAAALLIQAAPHLKAREVVEILLTTADDMGKPGVDEIYGWGRMNLLRALSPQGNPTVPFLKDNLDFQNRAQGGAVIPASSGTSIATAASMSYSTIQPMRGGVLQSALTQSSSLAQVMVLDKYKRSYVRDLKQRLTSFQAPGLWNHHRRFGDPESEGRMAFRLVSGAAVKEHAGISSVHGVGFSTDFGSDSWRFDIATGAGFSAVTSQLAPQGGSGSVSPYLGAESSGFAFAISPMARGDRGGIRFGTSVSSVNPDHFQEQWSGSAFVSNAFTLTEKLVGALPGTLIVEPEVGIRLERRQWLGSGIGSVLAENSGAMTTYGGARAQWRIDDRLTLSTSIFAGISKLNVSGAGLVRELDAASSSTWEVGLTLNGVFGSADQVIATVGQRLRLSSGSMTLAVPKSRTKNGYIRYEVEQLSLETPAQTRVRFGYQMALSEQYRVGFISEIDDIFERQTPMQLSLRAALTSSW